MLMNNVLRAAVTTRAPWVYGLPKYSPAEEEEKDLKWSLWLSKQTDTRFEVSLIVYGRFGFTDTLVAAGTSTSVTTGIAQISANAFGRRAHLMVELT